MFVLLCLCLYRPDLQPYEVLHGLWIGKPKVEIDFIGVCHIARVIVVGTVKRDPSLALSDFDSLTSHHGKLVDALKDAQRDGLALAPHEKALVDSAYRVQYVAFSQDFTPTHRQRLAASGFSALFDINDLLTDLSVKPHGVAPAPSPPALAAPLTLQVPSLDVLVPAFIAVVLAASILMLRR